MATLKITDFTKNINGKPLVRTYQLQSMQEGLELIADDIIRARMSLQPVLEENTNKPAPKRDLRNLYHKAHEFMKRTLGTNSRARRSDFK